MLPVRTVTATEAKVHFGQLLDSSRQGPVVVVRQGKPVAVVVSAEHYEALTSAPTPSWRELSAQSRQLVHDALDGRPLPSVTGLINADRTERDDEFDRLR